MESVDGSEAEPNDNLRKLKERLSHYVACECYSTFIEYWVPSQISNVQLEQYCSTLLSNSLYLLSCAKTDPVGALRDMLLAIRKVCGVSLLVSVPPYFSYVLC